jgi:hypothetical protein
MPKSLFRRKRTVAYVAGGLLIPSAGLVVGPLPGECCHGGTDHRTRRQMC